MGKSEGNLVLLDDLMAQGFEPLSYRYLALNNHYRSYLQFSHAALTAADKALMGLRRALADAGADPAKLPPADAARGGEVLEALTDDLNTPRALAALWTALRDSTRSAAENIALAVYANQVLSLNLFDFTRIEAAREVPPAVQELAAARWAARNAKQWAEADRLRDQLQAMGYVVRDSKDGYEVLHA
jgi:cysteinyl-tRNA synthetase